ncbi:hypothetical protein SADUNF_Sadunf04G0053200 [Salix dunnii]|uniref:SANTA domain-containing protein n=1 Tax=Salix dunnii TaxID=1413687 RepID=A0A835N3W7_9ROSI|nr:hypothetical protein SADUNF_Sadunf04G0053200 [Salix dunnii]
MATAAATSAFQKTVMLHDWWLIKAEQEFQGKKIAVAGFTSLEKKPVRVFHSAAITKRYDVFTLQTADGVTVLLHGYINRTLTVENGFSSKVFRHFCFGFPPDWEECGTKFLNSSCESVAEPPVSQNECRHSFLSWPVDEGVDDLKNDDSKNLSPLSSCHVNDVSWVENSVVVPAEPSGHHVDVALSSERIGRMKSKPRSFGKLMAKRSCSLERISIKNDASGERSVHTDYNAGNITRSNFDQTLPARTSVVLAVSLKERSSLTKKKRENEGNKDGLKSGIDFSILSLPQGPQSGAEANIVSPSMEETDTMDANLIDSAHRTSTASLTNLMDIPTQKSVSGHSVRYKAKGLISIEGKPKRNSGTTLDIAEAMLRASRKMNTPSGNSKSKEKKETKAVEKGGSSTKQARREIIFDADKRNDDMYSFSRILESQKIQIRCPFMRSCFSPCLRNPVMDIISMEGRLLLPTLDFWRNQIPVYDEVGGVSGIFPFLHFWDCDSTCSGLANTCQLQSNLQIINRNITGVQEQLGVVEPSRDKEEQKRVNKTTISFILGQSIINHHGAKPLVCGEEWRAYRKMVKGNKGLKEHTIVGKVYTTDAVCHHRSFHLRPSYKSCCQKLATCMRNNLRFANMVLAETSVQPEKAGVEV